jgi:glucose/mannose-6-phosphate isomerase
MADFKQIILDLPKQFEAGFNLAKDAKINGKFKNVIFCGMGGSIIPAEIMFTLFPELPNSFHIHRDFELPPWASKDDLVICISWSGNPVETISSYEAAKKTGAKIIVITKGGKLGKLVQNDGGQLISLPQDDIPPRNGIGYISSALLTLLTNSDMLAFQSNQLLTLENLKPGAFEKKGQELAERIGNWTPLIYSSFQNRFLASFWKIKFNENSKIHAFWNHFPNAAHNEIAGFGWDNFFVIFIKNEEDGPSQQKKILNAAKLLEENAVPYEIVELEGKNRLEKIFNDYSLSDWTSYYLAKNRGVDPIKNELIERFKKIEE